MTKPLPSLPPRYNRKCETGCPQTTSVQETLGNCVCLAGIFGLHIKLIRFCFIRPMTELLLPKFRKLSTFSRKKLPATINGSLFASPETNFERFYTLFLRILWIMQSLTHQIFKVNSKGKFLSSQKSLLVNSFIPLCSVDARKHPFLIFFLSLFFFFYLFIFVFCQPMQGLLGSC